MADEPDNLVLVLLREIRGQVGALDTKIDGLTNRVDSIETKLTLRMDELEASVSRLGHAVSGLADSIDVVMKQLRVLLSSDDPDRLSKLEQRLSALERAMVGGKA